MSDEIMIPIFRVKSAEKAGQWYARMGFEVTDTHQFEPHLPVYAFLKRGDVELHLSEHKGDAKKGALVYFWVSDVDTIAAEYGVPVETAPWAREATLTDPDGNRIRVATRS